MDAPSDREPPLTPQGVRELAEAVVGPIDSIAPLAGDASTRRFFRILLSRGGSLVAMVLGRPIEENADPQLAVGSYLESIGFPVPRLEAAVLEAGLLLYEDLGDTLLEDLACRESREDRPPDSSADGAPRGDRFDRAALPPALIDAHYAEAVQLILLLQGNGTRNLPAGHPSARSALDRARFAFELEFFRENYIVKLRELTLGKREERDLGEFLEALAAAAAAPPLVLCHRDYHCRNILVKDGRLRVVDFQDARMGPRAYDLASLLRDSYVVVPPGRRDSLIEVFLAGSSGTHAAPGFIESFDTVALQRNLKAIGTFAHQSVVLGKDRYLASIPPTWDYVFDELGRIPAFADARPILELAAGR